MAGAPIKELAKSVKPSTISEQFYDRLQRGELKTVTEWAYEFFDHDTLEFQQKIYGMMSRLRNRGVMAFPVHVDGPDKPRKVKIVNRDMTHFVEAFNRHAKSHAEPVLVNNFKIAENLLREHPRVRDQVLARAEHLVSIVADANKNLLGLPYGKPSALLGSGKAAPGRKPTSQNPK